MSYWLDHLLRGLTNSGERGCPEGVSRNVQNMIELRKNWDYEGSCTGRIPVNGLEHFETIAPDTFETLEHVYWFLKRRWRELSLADGKSVCKPVIFSLLKCISSRRIVDER